MIKFARDRRRWFHWLFEAKKRYGISILNYMATSNHIHLLLVDGGGRDVIPKSIQLVAGRTAQEYNQRKNRNGAFCKGHDKGRLNSESYETFLTEVLSKTRKHIILLQDGARYHTSKAMKRFSFKKAHRLTVYELPSYSPDYNPIEKL